MNNKLFACLALAFLSTLNFQLSTLHAQGTDFTYQGRLTSGTNVANGIYDLRFDLFSAVSSGAQIGPSRTNAATVVSNGFFAVTLDFTNGAFPGADRWLEIGVRTNGSGAFSTLISRQKITAAPYAITASNLSGPLPSAQLVGTYISAVTFNNVGNSFSGMFNGNGAGLTNVNALTLGGLTSSNFWRTTGNAGTTPGTHFLGTTDNKALEIKVNGLRTLRLEFNTNAFAPNGGAPNLIGGAPVNFVNHGVVGATISGGGTLDYFGGAYSNSVLADFGTVGGGFVNRIAPSALAATVAGGRDNDIGTNCSYGAIGGGGGNNIAANALYATIAGGDRNDIGTDSGYSAIGGGTDNNIAGISSSATIAGGNKNDIGMLSGFSAIGGGSDNNIANFSDYATIAGGLENDIGTNSYASTIGGGYDNNIATNTGYATIAGGEFNRVGTNSGFSAIGGGKDNNIAANAQYAMIPGGQDNAAGGDHSFAAGHRAKANHQGAFVWGDSTDADFASSGNNQFLIRAAGGVGIGVASPIGDLHIRGNSTNGSVVITPNNSNSRSQIVLAENTSASLGFIMRYAGEEGSNPLHFIPLNSGAVEGAPIMTLERNGGFVGIGTNNPQSALHVIGTVTATAFNPPSDRNLKENFSEISPRDVLDKVARLSITRWNFKGDAATPHLGPMAQDFYAAFGVGTDDRHIATVDADGVALAAIQGLNQVVKEKDAKIAALEKRLGDLEIVVSKLQNFSNEQ